MNKNLSKLFLIILPLIIVIVYAYFYTTRRSAVVPPPDISTFEECAAAGYYALDTSVVLTANYPYLTGGESITVEGALVPIEMVSADRWQIYDAVGIISVDKIIRK